MMRILGLNLRLGMLEHMTIAREWQEPEPTIRDLYPGLSDDQLAEAEDNLTRYTAALLRIHERLPERRLHSPHARNLTSVASGVAMEAERSNHQSIPSSQP